MIPDAFLHPVQASVLAPARHAVRGLPAAEPWLWLVRAGAFETDTTFGVVLLDRLPGLLVALGEEVIRRG